MNDSRKQTGLIRAVGMTALYYAYYDTANEIHYYYNPTDDTTVWDYPKDAEVLDPETMEPFPDPGYKFVLVDEPNHLNTKEEPQKKPKIQVAQNVDPEEELQRILQARRAKVEKVVDVSEPVSGDSRQRSWTTIQHSSDTLRAHISTKKADPETSDASRSLRRREIPRPAPSSTEQTYPALPPEVREEIHKFDIKVYAREHFACPSTSHNFLRTSVVQNSLIRFSDRALEHPLLSSLPKSLVKYALDCNKAILSFIGVSGYTMTDPAYFIYQTVLQHPELRDEIYFQLMKQTEGNPSDQWLLSTWNLFLIVATIFPSMKNSEKWIKTHIAKFMDIDHQTISLVVKFTYIRFCARCSIGLPLSDVTPQMISDIPSHPFTYNNVFKVSLPEFMWSQRRTHPGCPVPLFLHNLCTSILSIETRLTLDCKLSDKEIEAITAQADAGQDVITGSDAVHRVVLLKTWLAWLPDPVIPKSKIDDFASAESPEAFISSIPKINSRVLGYLIGVFRVIKAKHNLTDVSIAIFLAPLLFRSNNVQTDVSLCHLTKDFILYILREWDVSQFYPIST